MTIAGRKAILIVGALILSVSLNLFGAAAWGSHAFRLFESKDGRHRAAGYGISRLVRSAPEEARQIVQAEFEAAKPQIQERAKAVREARANITRLVQDPNLDSAALAAAFADLRRSREEVAVIVHRTLVGAIGKIPAEARIQWAEKWGQRR